MRDSHRVEDARVGGLRRGQVRVPIEVDQAKVRVKALQAGDNAQGDAAIAAQHQRQQVPPRR
jgi:hypothetical protein